MKTSDVIVLELIAHKYNVKFCKWSDTLTQLAKGLTATTVNGTPKYIVYRGASVVMYLDINPPPALPILLPQVLGHFATTSGKDIPYVRVLGPLKTHPNLYRFISIRANTLEDMSLWKREMVSLSPSTLTGFESMPDSPT